jgi:arsenical pump membrane protein
MPTVAAPALAIWIVVALATAGVILRPFRWPEAIWAVAGALLLAVLRLLPWRSALAAVEKGDDVYLFLTGMMLLSEVARCEGLFDWAAARAVRAAKGSAPRLFLLIYAVGVVVTVFLSNDATAVVLTPAVCAVTKKARVDPLPFLFICAFVANAASFVLPISNPANLVVYGGNTPALLAWLGRFALPSLLSIVATFLVLRWIERKNIGVACARDLDVPGLTAGGKTAMAGIAVTGAVLLLVSALHIALGWPTAVLGVATLLVVCLTRRQQPWPIVRGISWSILPLVAGLFVLVEALSATGVTTALAGWLHSGWPERWTAAAAGAAIAFGANLTNNLPAGLIASATIARAHASQIVTDCILVGVDLGPNLSVTGSLATILWLAAIRRDGEDVDFWRFLKLGAVVMPPALALAILARLFV